MIIQGATAYIPTALQIGGTGQTIKWQGGSEPTGNANKTDVFTFTITNLGASYDVIVPLVDFDNAVQVLAIEVLHIEEVTKRNVLFPELILSVNKPAQLQVTV